MKLKTAEWIWTRQNYGADEYAEFKTSFDYVEGDKVEIAIASDSNYALYINGKLAAFGQYADYPDYKVYDELSVSEFCKSGGNEVVFLVWYYGVNTQNYIVDPAGLIFEISVNDKVIAESGKETLSRLCVNYENGYKKMITSQLGLSFKYYGNRKNDLIFTPSVIIQKSKNLYTRPNEKLVLKDRLPANVEKKEYGYQIDMGAETVGFLDFDIEFYGEENIRFAYGQFLEDGRVRSRINSMDFTVEYVTHNGRNVYMNPFRRLSGRYLEVLCDKPMKINYVGIRPVVYPLEAKRPEYVSELRNRIYNTSVKTLISCMHEHYEDTPWREQALYTMDSRNEMLCTYKAFGDYKFARSNLVLISKGLRKDGMLSICYPAGRDIPIPSFSLAYILELYEYVQNSKDVSVLDETFDAARSVIYSFIERIDGTGLIADFKYPFWNFYEWSEGSDNGDQISRKPDDFYPEQRDLILNCYFLFVLPLFKKLFEIRGESFTFDDEPMRKAVVKVFYDKDKQLFRANDREDKKFYTELGNALAVLCGLAGEETAERMLNDKDVVPITLSMNTYVYEALLKVNGQKYKHFILNDIDKKYSRMLEQGATTFWETEKGAAALEHTGSLCHGWSAMPIYYYDLLNGKKYFNGKL